MYHLFTNNDTCVGCNHGLVSFGGGKTIGPDNMDTILSRVPQE
jgi:hypothetical protein